MKRKLLALAVSLTMALTMAACGSTEEVPVGNMDVSTSVENSEANLNGDATSSESEVSNDLENLKDETNKSESLVTPSEAPHEHNYVANVTQEPTCEFVGTIKYVCECGDSYIEHSDMLEHELGEYVYNDDATYEANGTESASCKLCGNVIITREVEGTKLVTPTPEPTMVPGNLDTTIGDELSFDTNNPIVAPNGATLSKLTSFNKAGLYNPPMEYVTNYDWCGYFNNDDPNDDQSTSIVMANNFDSMMASVYGSPTRDESWGQGFTVWNDTIYWYLDMGGASNGGLELHRHPSEGYYSIEINFDMSSPIGIHTTTNHRSVLLTLCTIISSTPSELEEALYNDAFVEATFTKDNKTNVGDCQVKILQNDNGIHYAIYPND